MTKAELKTEVDILILNRSTLIRMQRQLKIFAGEGSAAESLGRQMEAVCASLKGNIERLSYAAVHMEKPFVLR